MTEAAAMEYIANPEYSGVCLSCDGWRVIAGPAGNRYYLQRTEDGETFHNVKYRKLPGDLAAVLPCTCPICAADVAALPASAADAAPQAVERRAALIDAFRQNDWTREDYARVMGVDGLFRLIVSPDASEYILMRARRYHGEPGETAKTAVPGSWQVVARCKTVTGMRGHVVDRQAPYDPKKRFDRARSDILSGLLDDAPLRPRAEDWPELPKRPETAKERKQARLTAAGGGSTPQAA